MVNVKRVRTTQRNVAVDNRIELHNVHYAVQLFNTAVPYSEVAFVLFFECSLDPWISFAIADGRGAPRGGGGRGARPPLGT